MELFLTYPFFWSSLVGALVSAILIIRLPKYRKPMLVVGLLLGICFLISEYWFLQDYWNIKMVLQIDSLGGIDDILFGLTAGAIGTSAYDLIFRKNSKHKLPHRRWIYVVIFVNSFLSLFLLTDVLGLNSVVASAISFIAIALLMIYLRNDLLTKSLVTGLLGAIILVAAEALAAQFAPDFLKEHFLLHGQVPVLFNFIVFTEVLWGFGLGMLIGPLYDFAEGLKEK